MQTAGQHTIEITEQIYGRQAFHVNEAVRKEFDHIEAFQSCKMSEPTNNHQVLFKDAQFSLVNQLKQ
jgi:hypothetical protein